MKNIIFKKLGTMMLALLLGVSVFSLFPTVTKAETANVTWTNGSLVTSLSNPGQSDKATVGKTKGKWYWEVKVSHNISLVGITGESGPKYQAYYGYSGQIINNITSDVRTAYGPTFGANDVIGIALDLDNDKIVWYKNGVSLGANSVKPSELEGLEVFPMVMNGTSAKMDYQANFGASDFKYSIPEGFLPYQDSGTSTTPNPSTKPDPSTTPDPSTKPDPSTTPDPSDTDGNSQPTGDRAILTVTMDNGFDKEFDLSKKELNAFIAWYDAKDASRGASFFAIDKHNNNKGPFSNRKDYVIFNKILTFEVSEYSTK
ncbi:SPRY domain-containing protein [Paenibacillus sp. 1-18]|uniref:SPRY domain-containing protein n=1 Tax=Paenibacillus sp. 1-18 TaxID=1333846 RepID=UPI00047292D6|nr:SPRY domain-containing protein [Paenibacillus sp. 1-18]